MAQDALRTTLSMVAEAASGSLDRWWIVGSTAAILHGHRTINARDVDLMMSPSDAKAFLTRVGVAPGSGEPSELFRSEVFGRWLAAPLPVEVMGGFRVAEAGGWREVRFSTPQPVTDGALEVFVPSAAELIALFDRIGRTKDLERAELLRRGVS